VILVFVQGAVDVDGFLCLCLDGDIVNGVAVGQNVVFDILIVAVNLFIGVRAALSENVWDFFGGEDLMRNELARRKALQSTIFFMISLFRECHISLEICVEPFRITYLTSRPRRRVGDVGRSAGIWMLSRTRLGR